MLNDRTSQAYNLEHMSLPLTKLFTSLFLWHDAFVGPILIMLQFSTPPPSSLAPSFHPHSTLTMAQPQPCQHEPNCWHEAGPDHRNTMLRCALKDLNQEPQVGGDATALTSSSV